MRKLIWLVLLSSAVAQIPCPSNGVLNLPNDGPAVAPKACVNTALQATRSVVSVSGVSQLPSALKCSTTVTLAPGNYGSVTFPKCTAGNWFVIKVANDKSQPGSRYTPTTNVASFDHITAGSYNRIGPGIEVKQAGTYDSILLDARGASHVVILRSHITGTPSGEVAHAIMATSGADHIAVVGNVIEKIHCIAGGRCGDSQAVLIGCGAGGAAFLVENNYLEASGENVMSGGCAQSSYATDVIIERNHMFKPMSWMPGDPTYGGIRFLVKNSLELKSCTRCLIQYNILENSWGGFSQNGYSVLFTAKTQNIPGVLAEIRDITFRFNSMSGGAGFQIAAAKSDPPASLSSMGLINLSIHDSLISVDNKKYLQSAGIGMQLTLQDGNAQATGINVSNNTWTAAQNSALMLGAVKAGSLIFKNNILYPGQYQSTSTGAAVDCSKGTNTKPAMALTACWTALQFTGNYVIGGSNAWPAGTQTPSAPPVLAGVGVDMVALAKGLAGVR